MSLDEERFRLCRAFYRMRKVPSHGEMVFSRHGDIRPEWIVQIVEDPYDRYEERIGGELWTVLIGRVPESRQ